MSEAVPEERVEELPPELTQKDEATIVAAYSC